MKRFILSLVVTLMGTLGLFAQSDLVATLSHGANITEYYGADALSEAYAAAEQGDVITLSSGTFTAVTIEKAITVRGAGMFPNGVNSPTYLIGSFNVILSDTDIKTLTLEGINCKNNVFFGSPDGNVPSAMITKCYFKEVGSRNVSLHFIHCIFQGDSSVTSYGIAAFCLGGDVVQNTFVRCDECVVMKAYTGDNGDNVTVCKFDFHNCIVWSSRLHDSSLQNCIIVGDYRFDTSNCVRNCVFFTNNSNFVGKNNNIYVNENESSFSKNGLPSSYITEQTSFELTDEAAATYLGNDGTQVGIYGGAMPFNPTPSTSQLKKFNVNSTTDDGKLKVSIDVE